MVVLQELRICMPMTKAEYQVGMLYGVVQASLSETGGGEGVEVVKNEPYANHPLLDGKFGEGQYTKKIYHLDKKVPWIVRQIAPAGSLKLVEEAWNSHPDYCRTVITNPDYMKDDFLLKIETFCIDNDRGTTENAHMLDQKQLTERKVTHIDIGNDPMTSSDDPAADPSKYTAVKPEPNRGPLTGDWQSKADPVMTVYKLVTIKFKWWGLQTKVESFISDYEVKLFRKFHRQIFCWTDGWYGMTLDEIRKLEADTKEELEKQRNTGELRGTAA